MPRKPSAIKLESKTRERLLDAAEVLFGELGLAGASLRAIVSRARVNLATTSYYFGSKEALYAEVFLRRIRGINLERIALLDAAEKRAAGRPIPIGEIVETVLRPAYELAQRHPPFLRLLARNLLTPPASLCKALEKEMSPGRDRLAAALIRTLPHLPRQTIALRLKFCLGTLFALMVADADEKKGGCADLATKGRGDVFGQMVAYATAGFRAPDAAFTSILSHEKHAD